MQKPIKQIETYLLTILLLLFILITLNSFRFIPTGNLANSFDRVESHIYWFEQSLLNIFKSHTKTAQSNGDLTLGKVLKSTSNKVNILDHKMLMTDTDSDGVNDSNDLDDDNDGILDSEEGFDLRAVTLVGISPEPLNSADPADIQLGDVFVYRNVISLPDGTNYDVTFTATGVSSTVTVSDIISFNQKITSPNYLAVNISGFDRGDDDFFTARYEITEAGSSTNANPAGAAAQQEMLRITGRDVDGPEAFGLSGFNTISAGSGLIATTLPQGDGVPAGFQVYEQNGTAASQDPDNVDYHVVANYTQSSSFEILFGLSQGNGNNAPGRNMLIMIEVILPTDSDGDGIADHLDLDSDNDGIYDTVEAGHGFAHTNGKVNGAVGTDGIPDVVQAISGVNSGAVDYTLADSESTPDGIADFLELDADGDGCTDVLEAGFTDEDRNGLLGTGIFGSGLTVDANGVVTSGTDGYIAPGTDYTNLSSQPVCVSLPITLIQFDAKVQSSAVVLSWKTANEINNKYFQIERSQDLNNFVSIGIVDGAGNSNTILDYTFIDPTPLQGLTYYRLKQVDFDGTFSYSSVKAIRLSQIAGNQITISPNPATDLLEIQNNTSYQLSASIYDIHGYKVNYKSLQIEQEPQKIDLNSLSAGVYYILFSNGVSKKFIKK